MPNKNTVRTDLHNGTIIERKITPFSYFYDYEIKSPLVKKRFNNAKTTEEKNKILKHFITSTPLRGNPVVVIKDKQGNIVDGIKALNDYYNIAREQYTDYAYRDETVKQFLKSNNYTEEEKKEYLDSLVNTEYVTNENGEPELEFKTKTLPTLIVDGKSKLPNSKLNTSKVKELDDKWNKVLGENPEVLVSPNELKDIHSKLTDIITNPYYAKNYSPEELDDMVNIISTTGLNSPKNSLDNIRANNNGLFLTEKYVDRAKELAEDRSSIGDKFDSFLNKADLYSSAGQALGTTTALVGGAIPEPIVSKALATVGGGVALASSIASMGIDGIQAIRGLTQRDNVKVGINTGELLLNSIPYGKLSKLPKKAIIGINTLGNSIGAGLSQYDMERNNLIANTSAYNRFAGINNELERTKQERLKNAGLTSLVGAGFQGAGWGWTSLKNGVMPFVNNTILPRINRYDEGGLIEYNEGGTHEENPNGGVPIGVGSNGKPNTVEEGETRFGDYIFSNRLRPLMGEMKQVGLDRYTNTDKKKESPTYADYSKKINKEFKETPNDPISKRGQQSLLSRLQQAQEMTKSQKEEMRNIARQNKEKKELERRYLQELMLNQSKEPSLEQQLGLEEIPMPDNVAELGLNQFDEGGNVNSYATSEEIDSLINQANETANALKNNNLGESLVNILSEKDKSYLPLIIGPASYYGLGTLARYGTQVFSEDSFNKLRRKDLISYNRYGDITWDPLSVFKDKKGKFSADATKSKLARGMRRATLTSNHIPETANAIKGGFNNIRGLFGKGPDSDITGKSFAKKTGKGLLNLAKPVGMAYGIRALWDLARSGEDEPEPVKFLVQDRSKALNKEYTKFSEGGFVNYPKTNNFASGGELDPLIATAPFRSKFNSLNLSPTFNVDYTKGITGIPSAKQLYKEQQKARELQTKPGNNDNLLGYLQYAPAVINGMSVLSDLSGVTNKSNYEYADSIAGIGNHLGVNAPKIGTKVQYNPLDINYHTNKLINQGIGSRDALVNSYSGNRAGLQAGILSSNLSTQNAIGNLARQAHESNLQQRLQVANINNALDAQNAQMQMSTNQINLQNKYNRDKYLAASISAKMKEDMLTSQARNSNLSNLVNSLYNIGTEARRRRTLEGMYPNVRMDSLGNILELARLIK